MQILKGPMGFIAVTMFLNFMGLTIIIPVIPYIVAQYTTHVALYVGLITSFGALCQFLAGPSLGYVSDIVGRRPVVLLSLFGGVIGYIIFGIGGALWMLFLGRIIDGISSGDTPAMFAYIADIFKPEERGKYYGILGAAAGLGFMTGPAIGGLAAQISLTAPLFAAAAISLINVGWGYFAMPESLPASKREHLSFDFRVMNPFTQFRNVLSLYTLRVLFLTSFVFFIGLVMQQSNFTVFLKDIFRWGPTEIGIMLTVVGLVDFFSQGFLIGKLIPRFGEMKISRVGLLLTALGMFLIGLVAFTSSIWMLYIAIVIYTIGDGLFEPAMTGLISNATDPHMHGRVQGANQSIQSVARFIAPLTAGLLYEQAASLPYFASTILILATFVALLILASSLRFVPQQH